MGFKEVDGFAKNLPKFCKRHDPYWVFLKTVYLFPFTPRLARVRRIVSFSKNKVTACRSIMFIATMQRLPREECPLVANCQNRTDVTRSALIKDEFRK